MESIRRLLAKVNTYMSDLTPSQRLAIGLCVVVIVGSFMWLVRWSSEPDYVRLLEDPMSTEQLASARKALPVGGFVIRGGHIFVPAADRHEMFWRLQDADALPADTHITFERLIEDDSPFRPESENSFRRRIALQNELAKVIASSRKIQSADVFITDVRDRRINSPNTMPTGSITLIMAGGNKLDQNTVNACAEIVAGAVPGLDAHNVKVIDGATMQPFTVPSPEDAVAVGLLAEEKKKENHLRSKIEGQLSYIPSVRISVSVELDAARRQTRTLNYGEPQVAEETTLNTDSKTGTGSGEPGVGPNVGQSLASGAAGQSDTKDESTTKYQEMRLTQETTTQEFPFGLKRATATIGIPRSYIVGSVRAQSGSEDEPDAARIAAEFKTIADRVRQTVKTILMARRDDDVTVNMFTGMTPAVTFRADGTPVLASNPTTTNDIMTMLKDYGPEGGLALLAMVAMVMVGRIARRSSADISHGLTAQAAAPTVPEASGDQPLSVAGGPVGMAEPTFGSSLEGHEVDESTLRSEEMTRQVGKLVHDNPEGVAELVRRWTDTGQ